MSKNSHPNSTNPNYAVGYGRPPASSRFAPGTSGNPRGRPRRKERPQGESSQGNLSMLHQAILEAGAMMVEVKRGTRRVKVSTHAAVIGGLIESAQHGNTRAADMYLKLHHEAEVEAQRQSVDASKGVELTKYLARLIRNDGAAMRENERLKARIAELEGADGAHVVEPNSTKEAAADNDPPSRVVRPPAAQRACDHMRSLPQVVNTRPLTPANTAPYPAAPRRRDDPLLPNKGPVFGGGYGINGGRET